MNIKKFKFLKHTADVKFSAEGKTLEEAFTNSALALKETITRNVKIASKIKKEINVEGKDSESLLYNFLEEFLFLLDSESFIFSRIENLNISKNKLNAVVYGDKMENYGFTNDVKAITYSEMKIKKNNLGYSIVGVFDV